MTYGNPPKKYQFKKGQSGNPKGRPRKKPQTGTTLADDLRSASLVKKLWSRKMERPSALPSKAL